MGSKAARRSSPPVLPPNEILQVGYGLSFKPRVKLLLTFFRSDPAVKPVDEWQLKLSSSTSSALHSLTVSEDDLVLRKRPDIHKRKRDEPVASGTLWVRDLGFLGVEDEDGEPMEKKFLRWRESFLNRLGGIELNLEGVKFRMTVEVPLSDDFEKMKRSWEDYFALQALSGSNSKGLARRPDTIVVQGVPSRWFAEPRVSSKPSMLNTHTIFSVLGKLRNLYIAGDDDLGKNTAASGDVLSGLNCKIWAQFESYDEFVNAMRVLCGRSMQKEGSRLIVDYELSWDRDGFFRNVPQNPSRGQEKKIQVQASSGHGRNEAPWLEPGAIRPDVARLRRFKWRFYCEQD
ncbi:hypothetical protein HPP92_009335 [Vanilla planifolia]|uniref:Uncharacterized protein n=1 Tax=Vanilla planifolia TaxID=51239 RepID=A0A835V837_VANPL|nr:hypothetical protein HPP92_009335 [Vanilla planifolia]